MLPQTLLGECFANVSRVLRNDEFVEVFFLKAENRELRTGVLLRRPLLRHMPQAPSFNQAVKILGKIRRMVASPFQRLSHQ